MARYFFDRRHDAVSDDLFPCASRGICALLKHVASESGTHYQKTSERLARQTMDQRHGGRMDADLAPTPTVDEHSKFKVFMRWRIFFMACAELFGHDHGREWHVSHYLFEPADSPSGSSRS